MLRKSLVVGVVFAALVVFAGVSAYTADGKCPMAKVEKGLWCADCKAAVEKADLKDGNCAKCGKAPAEADLCVATGWHCEKDGVWAKAAGECGTCKGALAEKTVKALVMYQCPKCPANGAAAFKCDKCSADAEKTCSESGKGPHGS